MTYYKIKDETLSGIADAIREKCGTAESYSPGQMAAAIGNLSTGAKLNIAYGDTEPEDTTKLWVKTPEPSSVLVHSMVTGNENLETFVSALPTGLNGIGAAAVGRKVYLFGGRDDNGYISAIRVFDTESEVLSTLDTALPVAMDGCAAAAVGTKVYLFGGEDGSTQKTIRVFDTENGSISTLGVELYQTATYVAAATVGTKVYLFGGTAVSERSTIQVFDAESNTISVLEERLPSATVTAAATVGTNIYLFGGFGLTTIHVFDTKTNRLSQLSAALPKALYFLPAVAVGTKVYLFGGVGGGSAIYMFDAENETISCLDDTLPTAATAIGAAAVGTKIYLFGGNASSGRLSSIHAFVVSVPLEENVLLIETSQAKNMSELYTGEKIKIVSGVANVYRGNADGIAEKVSAYLNIDSTWVEI